MAAFRIFIIMAILSATAVAGLAATAPLAISASILDRGSCTITSTLPVTFPNLDPLNAVSVKGHGSVTIHCTKLKKPGEAVVVDLLTPTPLTLKHVLPASPALIPYVLELSTGGFITAPPGNGDITIPITGDILGSDYRLAPTGSYSDTVTIQVTP